MARPGIVNVEISIEEHLIALLNSFKRVTTSYVGHLSPKTPKLQFFYEAWLSGRGRILQTLSTLEGLESREQGRGKFIEVEEIYLITKYMNRHMYPPRNNEELRKFNTDINNAIALASKLIKMELRLG